MRTIVRAVPIALALCSFALQASAQPASPSEWSRGTAISGFAGVGADGSHTGGLFGGTLGWDLNPRIAIQGSGGWAEYGDGTDAFSASLGARFHLLRSQRVNPFVNGGVGFYRASFGPGASAPDFYSHRMRLDVPHRTLRSTFTDPSFVCGGGLNIAVNRRMRIRPEVNVDLVFRDSRTNTVPSFRMHFVYVFEDHPVTPSRR
jgi:hypothetical protein